MRPPMRDLKSCLVHSESKHGATEHFDERRHIFSERELMFTFAICSRLPVCRLSVCLSVCRLSVTFVHPTQPVELLGNVSTSIWYLGHPLTSTENLTEILPEEPLRRGS